MQIGTISRRRASVLFHVIFHSSFQYWDREILGLEFVGPTDFSLGIFG